MYNYTLNGCGNAAHNLRKDLWTMPQVIHFIHTFILETISRFALYPALHTYCTQLTHMAVERFHTVIIEFYTLYTVPTITTKYI